jgi:hypothetical protein
MKGQDRAAESSRCEVASWCVHWPSVTGWPPLSASSVTAAGSCRGGEGGPALMITVSAAVCPATSSRSSTRSTGSTVRTK